MSAQWHETTRWSVGAVAAMFLGMAPVAFLQGDDDPAIKLLAIGAAAGLLYLYLHRNDLAGLRTVGTPKANVANFKYLAAIIGIGYAIWGALVLGKGRMGAALICFALAAIMGGIWWAIRRYELGWTVDSNGERQKVAGRDRHGVLVTPTSHAQRRSEELVAKQERRVGLAFCTLGAIVLGALAVYLAQVNDVFAVFAGALAAICALGIPYYGGLELVYQSGFQHMKGAKVLDPMPGQGGVDALKEEKAHGDARLSTADNADSYLNP